MIIDTDSLHHCTERDLLRLARTIQKAHAVMSRKLDRCRYDLGATIFERVAPGVALPAGRSSNYYMRQIVDIDPSQKGGYQLKGSFVDTGQVSPEPYAVILFVVKAALNEPGMIVLAKLDGNGRVAVPSIHYRGQLKDGERIDYNSLIPLIKRALVTIT